MRLFKQFYLFKNFDQIFIFITSTNVAGCGQMSLLSKERFAERLKGLDEKFTQSFFEVLDRIPQKDLEAIDQSLRSIRIGSYEIGACYRTCESNIQPYGDLEIDQNIIEKFAEIFDTIDMGQGFIVESFLENEMEHDQSVNFWVLQWGFDKELKALEKESRNSNKPLSLTYLGEQEI